jgi:hypothetical protein
MMKKEKSGKKFNCGLGNKEWGKEFDCLQIRAVILKYD